MELNLLARSENIVSKTLGFLIAQGGQKACLAVSDIGETYVGSGGMFGGITKLVARK